MTDGRALWNTVTITQGRQTLFCNDLTPRSAQLLRDIAGWFCEMERQTEQAIVARDYWEDLYRKGRRR